MPKLTILRGISGSGKSTWARMQNAVVISRDDLRVAIYKTAGPEYYEVDKKILREREDYISVLEQAAIKAALLGGKDVVSDNTHTMMKYVNRVAKIGYSVGADVELKVFDIRLPVAIAAVKHRAANGGLDVPEDAIRRQHEQFQGSKNHVLIPPYIPKPYSGTPGKPEAFLFDLDGTAYHMGDKRGPYDHNVDVDDPDPVVQELVNALSLVGYTPIAMSGRVEATREKTEYALNRDGVAYEELFMRKDGDMRSDNIIKAELFDEFVRDNYNVKFVLDDRNQVVDMWRLMGLKCLQVQPGEF